MIKKLQALKAKKGFTLVELVVVIAIIGVLAAILIPTMIGVVQDANITSANTAANQIRTMASDFTTKAESMMKEGLKGPDGPMTLGFTVSNGTWAGGGESGAPKVVNTGTGCTATAAPAFGSGSTVKWTGTDPNTSFCAFMQDNLRDLRDAYVEITFEKGGVLGVAVRMGTNTAETGISADEMKAQATDAFVGKAGLDKDGQVIGTNPPCKMVAATTPTGSGT